MKSLYTILKKGLLILVLGGIFVGFGWFWSNRFFPQYEALFDYRRLQPSILPSELSIHATVAGHENLYADITWIRLVQFIADNMGNGKYLNFTHTILGHITEISPYFLRAYEADLLFAPTIFAEEEGEEVEKYRALSQSIVTHAESSLPLFCDMRKVHTIMNASLSGNIWEDTSLKNPCTSGKIPYYIASRLLNDLRQGKQASQYYALASMHDDVPGVARILSVLALSEGGRYDESAAVFLLLAQAGYDTPPYMCHQSAQNILQDLVERKAWDSRWIDRLGTLEEQIITLSPKNDILSHATDGCLALFERGIKQIYLGYITQKTASFPDITTASGILAQGVVTEIPYITSQKDGFTLIKRNGVWKYRKILP